MRYAAPALAGALVLFEYLAIPCPLSPARVSPFYHALAREEGDFAILELPVDDFHSREYLYPQTVHQKKLVNGYVARTPAGTQAFMRSQLLIKALQVQMEVDPALHDIPAEIGLLAANGIRYVIVHKQPLPPQPPVNPEVLASWQALLGPHPVYEDKELAAYRTRLPPGYSLAPILRFGDELGLIDVQTRRTQLLPGQLVRPGAGQFLTVDLTWRALRDLDQDFACTLSLIGPAGTVASSAPEVISPQYPTGSWPAGVVVAERYALPLDPALPAGDYGLAVAVRNAASGQVLGAAEHAIRVDGSARPLSAALEGMQFPAGVTFDDPAFPPFAQAPVLGGAPEMRLLGYTPHQEGERLALDLYWQALRAMEVDYKIFVHLIRPDDGAIVAQRDGMPRDWSYPTSLWARQEVFVDRVVLDVAGVEAGRYRLAVGVYEQLSERLIALGAGGERLADDQAVFEQAIEVQAR